MKLNKNQKTILLVTTLAIAMTLIYVPYGGSDGKMFYIDGWNFIWNVEDDIHIKLVLTEWLCLIIMNVLLLFYAKDNWLVVS